MRTIPDKIKREYESDDENRRIMEAYQRVLNPMIDEDATADALGTLKAILKSSDGDIKKMADGMMKSYNKNKGFSKDQANWIYKTSQALFKESVNISEDSTEDAKKTLDAIAGATKEDGGDIYKMAVSMKKSYEKNKGFSKDQAKWIYNTSQMLFKK
jgi:endonuclease III